MEIQALHRQNGTSICGISGSPVNPVHHAVLRQRFGAITIKSKEHFGGMYIQVRFIVVVRYRGVICIGHNTVRALQ